MKAQIVSFRCILKNKLGQIVSSSVNNDVINQLDEGAQNLKGLVAGLQNVRAGEKRKIFVPAAQAYGLYDPSLVLTVPRRSLTRGRSLELGSEILTQCTQDGIVRNFRVINADASSVILDGNHPLAGQDLTFEIEITSAREASVEDFSEMQANRSRNYVH